MTILVVITISNVACSCSHYNFDMPDITSRLVILYVFSVIIDKVRLPPQQDDCHEWSCNWKDCTTSSFSSLLLLNRWSWILFPGKIMDWVAQWMLPEMATTNISGPMNDWVGVTYDTDHPQARQLSTCSSVSPQSDTASSRFDIWNIGTIILIHLVYHMYTKFTLKYSCYLYSLAQWWMFHMDDICMSVPIVIQTCQHRVSLIPSNCLLTQTNISYTIVVMRFGMCNLS